MNAGLLPTPRKLSRPASLAILALAFVAASSVPTSAGEPEAVRLIDLTADGRLDKLFLDRDGLSVSVNLGGRIFDAVDQALPVVSATDVLVDDLDADGRVDLYVVSPGANVALLGDGAGRFVEATQRLGLDDAGPGVSAERVDVDGDGLADLLLHNVDGDVVFWSDGASFERDGDAATSVPERPLGPLPGGSSHGGAAGGGSGGGAPSGGQPGTIGPGGAPTLGSGGGVTLDPRVGDAAGRKLPVDPLVSLVNLFDERYVNDDAGEVDGADVIDGSLTGDDVSTSTGDVTVTGGRFGVGTTQPTMPIHVRPDQDNDWIALEQPGQATWEIGHFSKSSLGIDSAMRVSIAGSPLDLLLDDEPGGLRAYLWEDNRAVPDLPHTGIKPTVAVWGDILMGDIIAIERNPMTYFMRQETDLPSTSVTNFFSARAINNDVDGGAGIVLAPDELGDVNSGYVSIVAFGQGTGHLANAIRLATRSGPNTTTDRMVIAGNGNVGIGTPVPSERLHVVGDVMITGNLSKGGGSFRIDHPLDPANRTLSHSFVESPDMLNMYNGNVVLDERGAAVVELPEWFEALNADFTYQLTALGRPAPELHVAQPVRGNRFAVAGGVPGMTISWQLTGVRHDPYAEAHRIPVEEEKPASERGTYLHPDVYSEGGAPGGAVAGGDP